MDTNIVVISGRLGKDPESKFTPNGKQVVRMSVANNEQWTDANGEKQTRTNWVIVEAWGNVGKACAQFLKKGRKVLVEGHLRIDQVEDKYYTKITASSVTFLDSAPKANADLMEPIEATSESEEIPF